jgi:hypothetical protein
MLEPLAGFHRPSGHATATALALNVPRTGVIEVITVVDVSVSAAVSPGQKVAAPEQSCMSPTAVCAVPADSA